MTAMVVPFPFARRVAYIERHASYAASMRAEAGERYLQRQYDYQALAMSKRGIGAEVINREIRKLDNAIRAAMWAVIFSAPGGAA
jgi:hypothetical protein